MLGTVEVDVDDGDRRSRPLGVLHVTVAGNGLSQSEIHNPTCVRPTHHQI
jgi:hypothetical protein